MFCVIAVQAERLLAGTLATVAYLAEILQFIPKDERVWAAIAELEAIALLDAGDLQSAARLFQALHRQVRARAAANPANTQWQRDLFSQLQQARRPGQVRRRSRRRSAVFTKIP